MTCACQGADPRPADCGCACCLERVEQAEREAQSERDDARNAARLAGEVEQRLHEAEARIAVVVSFCRGGITIERGGLTPSQVTQVRDAFASVLAHVVHLLTAPLPKEPDGPPDRPEAP